MKQTYFTNAEVSRLVQAIRQAELLTSGEIRLHVEARCWRPPLERAAMVFQKLNMHQTAERNGVLIYLAVNSRKFAIIGDSGINRQVPLEYWQDIKRLMKTQLQSEQYCEALCLVINRIGETLQHYFPRSADDRDELSNAISFG